jgi:syntaxin 1B/2/3
MRKRACVRLPTAREAARGRQQPATSHPCLTRSSCAPSSRSPAHSGQCGALLPISPHISPYLPISPPSKANKLFAKKNPGASEARIRTNMHATLTRKFVDLMAEYQEVQTRYKSKYRERVERQYRIVKPTVTQDEIDAALDGDPSNQPEIFTQTILQGPGHAQARNALADIQDKHRDILKLEASIAELHQLFLDMSVLVETQGELLDQIEYTVAQSVDYTGRAVEELRSAAKYQKRARQKCCCVIVTLLIVAGILLATIIPNFS